MHFRLECKRNQKKSVGHAIHYDILTKLALFKKYLLGSENLIVKLASGISNIEIGQVVVVIPTKLIEFIDNLKATHRQQSESRTSISCKFRITSNVFDAQQKIIGEILMDLEMSVYDRVLNDMEMQTNELTVAQQQFNGIENNMNHVNKMRCKNRKKLWTHSDITNTEKIIPHERMPLSLTAAAAATTKRISSKSTNVPSSLLNYLTGRPLHAAEETEAVRAMESTSPTESLIDLLSYDLNGLYLPKATTATNVDANLLKKIDCMRIHINDLCLTRAGIREILSNAHTASEMSFGSGTFTVSIDFDSILSATATKSPYEKRDTKLSSNVIRIFNTSIETVPPPGK